MTLFLTRWQRWLNILTRTIHMGCGALLFGGAFYCASPEHVLPWHHLTIVSGVLLLLLEWYHDRAWPHRAMGILVFLHILLGVLVHPYPSLTITLLWAVIISGSIGSHMPRSIRHWSLLYGPEKRRRK